MPKLERPFKCYIYMSQGDLKDLGSYSEWIYKNRMKVIGEFICNEVEEFHEWELSPQEKFAEFEEERLEKFLSAACLSRDEVFRYRENLLYCKPLYGWHISDLKIYDKPKKLSEFRKPFIDYVPPKESKMVNPKIGISEYVNRPPQSYMFVEEVEQ